MEYSTEFQELTDQEFTSTDIPGRNHAGILSNINGLFYPHREKYRLYSQLSVHLNGWDSIPDFCLYPHAEIQWDEDELVVTTAPIMVIEILSPIQAVKDLTAKFKQYFKAGVQSCWLVNPTLEEVVVFDCSGTKSFYHDGTITDPATAISIAFSDIFE